MFHLVLVCALGLKKLNQEFLLYGDCVGYLIGVIIVISVGKIYGDKVGC